jgi:hypothetical protein
MEASSKGGQGPSGAVATWMDEWMEGSKFCPYIRRMARNWSPDFLVICFVTHNVQVSTDTTIMIQKHQVKRVCKIVQLLAITVIRIRSV